MPIQHKDLRIPVAQTPEFEALLLQIRKANSMLADIGNQIVAIEATMKSNPTPGAPAQDPSTGPITKPITQTAPSTQAPESFEESIAEMRRIAGIK